MEAAKKKKGPSDDLSDKIKELEIEIKQVSERIADLASKITELSERKGGIEKSTLDDPENEEAKDIEEARKLLESELRNLKGRTSQMEDKLNMCIIKIQQLLDESDEEDNSQSNVVQDNVRTQKITNQLTSLKNDIKDLEEILKKLRIARPLPTTQEGVDYMSYIEELQDTIIRLEDAQSKTEFRSSNNESRIDKLENEIKDHNAKFLGLFKDYKSQKAQIDEFEDKLTDLKEKVSEKLDIDEFNEQMNCKILFYY